MFQVVPLAAETFAPLFELSDAELAERRIMRQLADCHPGFPCRVSLRNADIGETVLLLNYEHLPAPTPFRSSHAIYVRQGAQTAMPVPGEVPEALDRSPMLSVRGFSWDGMLRGAELVPGGGAADAFDALLAREDIAYLHAHFAKYG